MQLETRRNSNGRHIEGGGGLCGEHQNSERDVTEQEQEEVKEAQTRHDDKDRDAI